MPDSGAFFERLCIDMNSKEEMTQNLINELNSYYSQYIYLVDIMNVFEHLGKFKVEEQKIAPNYFSITYAALIDSFMLTFARLYDNSKQTKSIQNLIDKCKKNIFLFSEQEKVENKLNEFEHKMKEDEFISPAITTIKYRRDKLFVHNDKKLFNHPENDSSHLPMYQLWFLRDFTNEVLSYLLDKLGEEPNQDAIYDNDLKKIIDYIKDT